ncbi:transportin-3 [Scaptodrosophila lebanonensis]|uniref:Transportin-3 n=1 Tax=Drosophila lebanonensis TaxID=7225 RepID=A0A6J2U4Q7_DROLE|nr:transportin-3 [Scaptodrosophila lebanonensis]
MDTYSVDVVYQAISALFQGNNPKEQEKANKWLQDFQKSIYSWTIADELLHQKRDLHANYFAAQTMRNKIQNSFSELPPHTHESLRDSLITHIGQIDERTDNVIVTQLSLAVADLALLMATWQEPINDLLKMLAPHPAAVWPLLEVLKVLPEEIDSRYLRLGANRREEVHKQLDASAECVLKFLCMCLQREDLDKQRILNATLRTFSAWLVIHAFPSTLIYDNPLAQEAFRLLSQPDTSSKLHDNAAECVCALISCIGSNNSDYRNNESHVEAQIFSAVCMLEPAYHMSVAHEDTDKTINYCRIFTSLCDAFFYDMLSNENEPHHSLKGLDLVLLCVGHFDYEVAEITFHLWYRISEDLFQRYNDKLTAHFRPHIERLISALYRHSQMESDHDGLIEESNAFYDFRRKVSDLIKDVAFIVGSGACFKQMFLILQAPETTWESTEAALFIMQNVAKNILPDENEVIPKVVEAILNMSEQTHIAVRYTSILLIGELCDWIENHPESLQAVLNFLLYALQQKNGLAPAAAIALTSICAACRQKMVCHISGLVEIARSLDSFQINNEVAIGLLKGISLILTRLPREQLQPALREIVGFQLQPLAHLVDSFSPTTPLQKGDRTDPVYWIDRACAIIRHTNPDVSESVEHPTVAILNDAWPLVSRVMDTYQSDLRIMERTCRLLRYSVRMVRKQAILLVEPLIKQMVVLYALYHHSCFLYVGSILVDEFAKSNECISILLEMLQAFIEPTFSLLQLDNGLRNNPDTVDDFFRLASRYLDCCPLQLLRSNLITPIFQCALIACSLDHREANSSVMKFFNNLLTWGRTNNSRHAECRPLVVEIAIQHGDALVVNLIHASVFSLHSYMLADVAEVLNELKQVITSAQMEKFLAHALEALPKKNSGGYVTATQEQLDEFSSTVLRADTTKAISQALKTFTRLFR